MSHALQSPAPVDGKYYEVARPRSLAERIVIMARDRIYDDFMRTCRPRPGETIVDVGVSDVVGEAANVLERRYPHPEQITAAGLGSAEDFKAAFPRVHYRRIEANRPLPFADLQFDIVASNAVLEHVCSAENQRRFLSSPSRPSSAGCSGC